MLAYMARRTLLAAFTILVISFIAFLIVQLPEGDAVDYYLEQVHRQTGDSPGRSPQEMDAIRELWGLNKPLVFQYVDWMSDILLRGDFGYAYIFGDWMGGPVSKLVAARIPYTIYLTMFTISITWVFAIPVGIYSAVRQHSLGDYAFTLLGFTGLAVPDFLLGLVLMYVFFAYFDQSVGGAFSAEYDQAPWSFGKLVDMIKHMIIPGIVLGTAGTAGLIRIMRNNLLDELSKPYVVTARAKGLAGWRVVVKYPVRVAINPFVSGLGGMLPALISGSVIVSVVLGLPTLGPMLLEAIIAQEMELTGTIILLLASLTVLGTLISDLLLVVVDPRIKLTGSGRSSG